MAVTSPYLLFDETSQALLFSPKDSALMYGAEPFRRLDYSIFNGPAVYDSSFLDAINACLDDTQGVSHYSPNIGFQFRRFEITHMEDIASYGIVRWDPSTYSFVPVDTAAEYVPPASPSETSSGGFALGIYHIPLPSDCRGKHVEIVLSFPSPSDFVPGSRLSLSLVDLPEFSFSRLCPLRPRLADSFASLTPSGFHTFRVFVPDTNSSPFLLLWYMPPSSPWGEPLVSVRDGEAGFNARVWWMDEVYCPWYQYRVTTTTYPLPLPEVPVFFSFSIVE